MSIWVIEMGENFDFFPEYRGITNKLKKRFLKKPNNSEGSEQFHALAKRLQEEDSSSYAAFCLMAQARCEHSLSNTTGETTALVEAAQQFLNAEHQLHHLQCVSFQTNLNNAIHTFSHAIRVHIEEKQFSLAAVHCLQLGNALRKLNRTAEAIVHFHQAANLMSHHPLDCIHALKLKAISQIETCDYHGALIVLLQISSIILDKGCYGASRKPFSSFVSLMSFTEINIILLQMLVDGSPNARCSEILEKYWWEPVEDQSPIDYMSENLFLNIQSFIMACHSNDLKSIQLLQQQLHSSLSTLENHLVAMILEKKIKES